MLILYRCTQVAGYNLSFFLFCWLFVGVDFILKVCHNHNKPRNEESQVLNAFLNIEGVPNLWGGGEEHYSLASVES